MRPGLVPWSSNRSQANAVFLSRLNLVLVTLLKQDWPQHWPSFIGDLVESSRASEQICENNMQILRLLSEEVFDFSRETMTAAKMNFLKTSLNDEFTKIFRLCEEVLSLGTTSPRLVVVTLRTLQRFLSWIPLGYIFETSLISSLISKFFPMPAFRTPTLDCLTEMASLSSADIPPPYRHTLKMMLVALVARLGEVVPSSVNLAAAFEQGTEDDCLFISRLALFLSTYLRLHLSSFESSLSSTGKVEYEESVVEALSLAIRVSEVRDDELFKTCLELWQSFSKDLYAAATAITSSSLGSQSPLFSPLSNAHIGCPIVAFYERHGILRRLRNVIIDRMAKPEEVIIVEDENGDIVREQTKDTEVIAQYKSMRETLVYLTHLNYEDTETLMLFKLEAQVEGGHFTWNGLNTLCWAVGSISGAMGENDEKKFLVTVIKDLLRLCEDQRGKDNKAVVASNIMYIVGQYPRFLRAHWKFLKTVVNKLFEFMHELHPGVQDMACDTFLKIAQKCKRKFTTPQMSVVSAGTSSPSLGTALDTQPYLLTLIAQLPRHTTDLQPHQVLSFYESVATMLSDKGPSVKVNREEAMMRLMDQSNSTWTTIMSQGEENVCLLESIRELQRVLKINAVVCSAAGSGVYIHQLSFVFLDMMQLYRLYSIRVREAVANQGDLAPRLTLFKAMRGVKSEILELLTAFVSGAADIDGGGEQIAMNNFVPPIMQEILEDYRNSPSVARDAKVLSFVSSAVAVLKDLMTSLIPSIMDAIFEPTLSMITTNMLDYPEHRVCFFRFLREANQHCFPGLFIPLHQKLIVDSVVWAFKHTERNISETGLEVLCELLQNMSRAGEMVAQPFYQQYFLALLQDVLGIMTDRLHKSGFKLQAAALRQMLITVQSGAIVVPLFEAQIDNLSGLKNYIVTLLVGAFPNLTKVQVQQFVLGLFDGATDLNAFKQHMRDFLIQIKEFSAEDNTDLYLEETEASIERVRQQLWQYKAAVPGLLAPGEGGLGNVNDRYHDDGESD